MGDNLAVISIPFTANPKTDRTTDPTTVPTTEPTYNPTTDPTTDPTTEPTRNPTVDPTANPTIDPTQDPTVDPTKQPTTICEPFENCTECVGVNSVVPDCFWHVTYQRCYHYNEVTNYDPTQFRISCHKLVSSSICEWTLTL